MMIGAVAAGDGVALVPMHSSRLPHDGCVLVRLRSPVPVVELLLVHRRREAMPELATLHELLLARARASKP